MLVTTIERHYFEVSDNSNGLWGLVKAQHISMEENPPKSSSCWSILLNSRFIQEKKACFVVLRNWNAR